jgi:hypothetical protein
VHSRETATNVANQPKFRPHNSKGSNEAIDFRQEFSIKGPNKGHYSLKNFSVALAKKLYVQMQLKI